MAMVELSLSFAFGSILGHSSITFPAFAEMYADKCATAADWLAEGPADREGLGWLFLPSADVRSIKETGLKLRGYDNIVHVGIGGSALGNLMLNQALFGDFFCGRKAYPDFYLADNPDPSKTRAIWEKVKYGRTALVGVSKSGATAETMSQFLWFRQMLEQSDSQSDADVFVVTDPYKGIFRAFAEETGCHVLDLPPTVGGRYSVLSAAALAEAYALGADIEALLGGAKDMQACLTSERDFLTNPARLLAAASCLHESQNRPMSVLMPYSGRLAYFGEWYAQLWGESLGKDGRGTTPVRAVGAIDQHSQVQLYTEGPDDKFYTLINVKDRQDSVVVPDADCVSLKPLAYMEKKDIGTMLSFEAMSTAAAIVKSGRPLMWIEAEKLDERTLGALVFFYEYVTAMTGRMMGIDPFDQPGVEQGKKYTYGLMGRSGYEDEACEAKLWFAKIASGLLKL